MLGNLRDPPEPFQDIIRTHFRLKAKSIMVQLDQWLSQDDGKPTEGKIIFGVGTSLNDLERDVNELKKLLQQLQDSEISAN
jgi:hypothetical protein